MKFMSHSLDDEYNHVDIVIQKCNTQGCNSPDDSYGTAIMLAYIDAEYDHTDATNPVKYHVNMDNFFQIDTYGRYHWYYKMRENRIVFLNGTTTTFYSLENVSLGYQYVYSDYLSAIRLELDDFVSVYTQYEEYQPDLTPTSRRALSTTSETSESEVSMSFPYTIFYIFSSLGGFYAICVFIIGILLRPAVDKFFIHECVNSSHIAHKVELSKLKAASETPEFMGAFGKSASINLNELQRNPGQGIDSAREKQPLVTQEEYKSKADANKSMKNKSKKDLKRSKTKERSMKSKYPESSEPIHRSKSLNQKSEFMPSIHSRSNRMYNTSDLWYNIFCCIKMGSKAKGSRYSRHKNFMKDANVFNSDRDLVNVVSKINMLQFKVNSIEETLERNAAKDMQNMAKKEDIIRNKTMGPVPSQMPSADPNSVYPQPQFPPNPHQNVQSQKSEKPNHKIGSQDFENMKNEIKNGPPSSGNADQTNSKSEEFWVSDKNAR